MKALVAVAVAFACLGAGVARAASVDASCLPRVSVPMTVRIGSGPAVAAHLEGGLEAPLALHEAGSGHRLWWAGAHPAATQEFPAMTAGFSGSLAAIDLDGDGLQDRVYAGDMAGRIWRFDLHHGADAAAWASGGVFADFSNDEGRAFLAAPDIALSPTGTPPPRLTIAVGTAAPGNAAASNRFYVLHDVAAGTWTDEDFGEWQPLREEDLTRVEATVDAITTNAGDTAAAPGWYVELGQGHVITPSLTVHGRAVLAIAAAVPQLPGPCEVFVHVASLDLAQRQLVAMQDAATGTRAWRMSLQELVPAAAVFGFQGNEAGILRCQLGGQHVAACDVDTRPRRTWWRREDGQ